jgi:hypothetical protein
MTIRVHIERLVLDGLPLERRHAPAVRQAVETELARQLSGTDASASLRSIGATDSLPGGTITLGRTVTVAALGGQISGALVRSFTS